MFRGQIQCCGCQPKTRHNNMEVAVEQEDKDNGARIKSEASMHTPEHWDQNHFGVYMTMLD